MSRDQVLGDDDLLIEILIRMPPKSIYHSRSVSKRWNNLISSTSFQHAHKARKQQLPVILALMVTSPDGWMPGISADNYTPDALTDGMIITWGYKHDFFRSSSNGLILVEEPCDHLFKVVNLQTDVCVRLPPPPQTPTLELLYESGFDMALVYEEAEAEQAMEPRYKVVIAPAQIDQPIDDILPLVDALTVLIYSSHTGCWTESSMRSYQGIFKLKCFKPPVSINGFIHWYCDPWGIAIMSTKTMVDIHLIPLPEITSMEPYFNFGFTRSSCDDIWFAAINNQYDIKFWRLPRGYHSTNSTTQIGLDDWILMDSDSLTGLKCPKCNDPSLVGVVKIEALIPWDGDIIVLFSLIGDHNYNAIFVYHRLNKSLDFRGCYNINFSGEEVNIYLGFSPLLEPLTLSSYGPLKQPLMLSSDLPSKHRLSSIWRGSINFNRCSALMLVKVVVFTLLFVYVLCFSHV